MSPTSTDDQAVKIRTPNFEKEHEFCLLCKSPVKPIRTATMASLLSTAWASHRKPKPQHSPDLLQREHLLGIRFRSQSLKSRTAEISESRCRVKEHLKKSGGLELYDAQFSYPDLETGLEKRIGVPEQGRGSLIPYGHHESRRPAHHLTRRESPRALPPRNATHFWQPEKRIALFHGMNCLIAPSTPPTPHDPQSHIDFGDHLRRSGSRVFSPYGRSTDSPRIFSKKPMHRIQRLLEPRPQRVRTGPRGLPAGDLGLLRNASEQNPRTQQRVLFQPSRVACRFLRTQTAEEYVSLRPGWREHA